MREPPPGRCFFPNRPRLQRLAPPGKYGGRRQPATGPRRRGHASVTRTTAPAARGARPRLDTIGKESISWPHSLVATRPRGPEGEEEP